MEQVSLPIKTKIAAWWIMVTGAIGSIGSIAMIVSLCLPLKSYGTGGEAEFFTFLVIIFYFLPSLLFLLSGLFLFKIRKRWIWRISIVICFVGTMISLGGCIYGYFDFGLRLWMLGIILMFFPPFILLFLDRKNFWKIAS